MRIEPKIGDLVQRIGDDQAQVGYSVTGRSGGRMTLCVICTVHKKMRSACFLVEPQKQVRRVSWFGPRNQQLRFDDLVLKITATVSLFELQNQVRVGLSV
jgi:hypothetical protein